MGIRSSGIVVTVVVLVATVLVPLTVAVTAMRSIINLLMLFCTLLVTLVVCVPPLLTGGTEFASLLICILVADFG